MLYACVCPGSQASSVANIEAGERDVEVAEGYTMTQFCDKMIDFFLIEKPRVKEWRKYLILRDEWNKYRERFYSRCHSRANMETDPVSKDRYSSLAAKIKRV